MSEKKATKYNVGLVLSGGGTRGFAHLGVIQALNDNEIFPDIISGTSAGAIAGVFIADGKKPREVLKILSEKKITQYIKLFLPKKGLLKMSGFEKTLKKTLKATTFEELKIPLIIYAVNINKGVYTRFDKGDIIEPVKASSSIPVIFPPVKIDGEYYLDGGIINNFPIAPLIGICKTIIGVNLNPVGETNDLNSIKKIAERSFHISLKSHTIGANQHCDIYIEPSNLEDLSLLNLSKAQEAFDIGYQETIKVLKEKGMNK